MGRFRILISSIVFWLRRVIGFFGRFGIGRGEISIGEIEISRGESVEVKGREGEV